MPKNESLIIIVCCVCVLMLIVSMGVYHYPSRQTIGNTALMVYAEGLTVDKSVIDWGNVTAGETRIETVTINNTGTQPLKLNVTVQNWRPEALAEYMTVTWNYTNEKLDRNETLTLSFSLAIPDTPECLEYVRSNNVTAFSFDIILEVY